ncbi:MAG: sodium ion-translocating decarboxylase subunit beta [Nitrososphaerota archaeon]|nr:sodium ion-translocating decarboxylase subunit beta [Nitrososphaerales archaeon]MDW8044766.1 sodium ion-translocating decarboxylase subunit beta [Nitrososphaerota archaeon]
MVDLTQIFPGISTLFTSNPTITLGRIILIIIGMVLAWSGYKRVTEPLILIPMGMGMVFANSAFLILPPYPPLSGGLGTPHLNPLVGADMTDPSRAATEIVTALTLYWLQPIYELMFLNGLIACLVFMGIGAMTDLDFFIAKPLSSFFLAIFAELGTILVLPLAVALGYSLPEAASIAIIGGADGPLVLFTSLKLAPSLFVPITVITYLYLSILYVFQGRLNRMTIPLKMRSVVMDPREIRKVSKVEKVLFDIIAGGLLCLLFPAASPLIASFFLGNILKEAEVERLKRFLDDVVLNGSTLFLGFTLGILLTPDVIFDPKIIGMLVLGITALILSSIGGSIGGILIFYLSKGKINALLGPAGVSCVPTTAKIAQYEAQRINKRNIILPFAMGPNIAGVLTTAILSATYIAIIPTL